MSLTPVVHLKLWISPPIFEKNSKQSWCDTLGLGETDSWKKKLKSKILWHCLFKPTRRKPCPSSEPARLVLNSGTKAAPLLGSGNSGHVSHFLTDKWKPGPSPGPARLVSNSGTKAAPFSGSGNRTEDVLFLSVSYRNGSAAVSLLNKVYNSIYSINWSFPSANMNL